MKGPTCEYCGRCLSVCPSYKHHLVETFGPRARIDLARAVAAGELEPGLRYEDYFLQFPEGSTARRAECTPGDCRMLGQVTDYPLINDRIPLSHELFADRVLILTGMPKTVTLRSEEGKKQVTVSYPDMRYLGIWKCLGTQAPYVCIEPWTGVSARAGIVEDYAFQPDMIHLAAGKHYENHWSILITEE